MNVQKNDSNDAQQRRIGTHAAICMLMLLISLGCARTASSKSTLLQVEIEFTFRDNIDTQRNAYYIMFSPSATPALPDLPPSEYFPTPGQTFSEDNQDLLSKTDQLNHYYKTFFKSWSDYMVIYKDTLKLYKSGTTGFDETTTQNARYTPATDFSPSAIVKSGNTIKVTFFTQDLSGSPSNLYFTAATSEITDGTETGNLQDKVRSDSPLIRLFAREEAGPRSDTTNDDLNGSVDILAWRARVF